jgi:AcrR family transcriptional regulator
MMPKIIVDQKIFRAVIQVVIERGYAGATTKQMADAAEVSEVTLFRKYGSKLELIRRALAAIIEEAGFELAIKYTGEIRLDLLNVLRSYQKAVAMNEKFFVAIIIETSHNPELARSFTQPLVLFRSVLELLARYQEEGAIKHEHPLNALAALFGPLIYLAMIGNSMPETQVPLLDLEIHVDNFLEGRAVYPREQRTSISPEKNGNTT